MHARDDALARARSAIRSTSRALDLDELPALDRELRLFSHGGRNLFAFHDARLRGHAVAERARLRRRARESLAALRAGDGLPAPHTTRLVTNLRSSATCSTRSASSSTTTRAGALTSRSPRSTTPTAAGCRYVLGPRTRLPDRRAASAFATSASCSCRRSCTATRPTTSGSTRRSTATELAIDDARHAATSERACSPRSSTGTRARR